MCAQRVRRKLQHLRQRQRSRRRQHPRQHAAGARRASAACTRSARTAAASAAAGGVGASAAAGGAGSKAAPAASSARRQQHRRQQRQQRQQRQRAPGRVCAGSVYSQRVGAQRRRRPARSRGSWVSMFRIQDEGPRCARLLEARSREPGSRKPDDGIRPLLAPYEEQERPIFFGVGRRGARAEERAVECT